MRKKQSAPVVNITAPLHRITQWLNRDPQVYVTSVGTVYPNPHAGIVGGAIVHFDDGLLRHDVHVLLHAARELVPHARAGGE